MRTMNPDYMGGFQTSAGPEIIQTWAAPIPILDEIVLKTAMTLDEDIPLIITDVRGRQPLTEATYADMWLGTARRFGFDPKACAEYRVNCTECPPALLCPSGAFTEKKDGINGKICYHCGICAVSCHGNCFRGEIGSVLVDGKKIPLIQRLSDRVKASMAASELKKGILDRSFRLTRPVENLQLKS
jgi:uncharacterized protein (DUF39 family)